MFNRTKVFVFLICLNILAHFLPFERASIGNDDYALSVKADELSYQEIFSNALRQPDRPLSFIFLMLQEKLSYGEPQIGFMLMVILSSALLIAIFLLLEALLNDSFLAVVGAIIFCLLPNKLEMYHIPVYTVMDIANIFHVLSFLFTVYYTQSEKRKYLWYSIASYSFAIFFYEPGFFLPIILISYVFLFKREKLKVSLLFIIPSAFYLLFKLTNVFGLGALSPVHTHSPSFSMIPFNLVDLAHHYTGRYMARNLLYGLYKFFTIESPWLLIIILLNFLAIAIFMAAIKNRSFKKIDARFLPLSVIIFFSFALPILINSWGGVGARHLVLPSIGIGSFLLWVFSRMKRYQKPVLLTLLIIFMITCQGGAWTQVVACRLNRAIYETLIEKREKLMQAKNIVIDIESFTRQIDYSWLRKRENYLNTYYGAQAIEDWGLISMVRLVTGEMKKGTYVAVETPRQTEGRMIFSVTKLSGYRNVAPETITLPVAGTLMIDFYDVFGNNFNDGKRLKL